MKILGIDHATVHGGYAVFDGTAFLDYEQIELRDFPQWSPMYAMFNVVDTLIQEHAPDICAIEKPMALRNGKVARQLIEVYAGGKMAAESRGIEIVEVTPQLAKQYTAGHSQAEKEDVARALVAQFKLPLDEIAVPEYYKVGKKRGHLKQRLYDVSDACALCVAAMQVKRSETLGAVKV